MLTTVAGDFNADGYDDMVVGVPYEDVGSIKDAGLVQVLYGSSSGVSAAGDDLWDQNRPGVRGIAEAYDHFGDALAAGDFDGDGRDDLAIGVPGEDVGSIVDAGLVQVLYGSSSGVTASGDDLWNQATTGVRGKAEEGDNFGRAVG